jgi:hypothetical protein
MRTALRDLVAWERVRNLSAVLGIVNTLLLGFVGVYLKRLWNAADLGPRLSMVCPPNTRSSEVEVFGERTPNGDQVELFVEPLDGANAYYAQGKADSTTTDRRAWAKTARLGNPYGLGHRKPPPLDFDLIAVLRNTKKAPAVDLTRFPGDGISFDAWVSEQPGIKAVTTCRINRMPELTFLCSNMPVITSPAPSCCPVNASGHACPSISPDGGTTTACNPARLNQVHSPVVMEWSRNIPMYVEIDRHPPGTPVKDFPRQIAKSGSSVPLQPGTYEIEIRQDPVGQCVSSSWFEVVEGQ